LASALAAIAAAHNIAPMAVAAREGGARRMRPDALFTFSCPISMHPIAVWPVVPRFQRRTIMTDTSKIREHMEVIGADGVHVGTVDHIEGDRIKLTRRDSGQGSHKGHHHYIPASLIAEIEGDKVRLSANSDVVANEFEEEQSDPT
jgi:hypothetical protein